MSNTTKHLFFGLRINDVAMGIMVFDDIIDRIKNEVIDKDKEQHLDIFISKIWLTQEEFDKLPKT